MAVTRHHTDKPGIYYLDGEDGRRTYLATWKVERSLAPTDPLATQQRTVARRAPTFAEACRLQAEGEAAERTRRRTARENIVQRLTGRLMAAKWFEYRADELPARPARLRPRASADHDV
jgi:hypothetical protein